MRLLVDGDIDTGRDVEHHRVRETQSQVQSLALNGGAEAIENTRKKAHELGIDLSKDTPGSSLDLQAFNGGQPFLDLRGIPCPDDARARIESCAEAATLTRWLSSAKTATSVDQVLADTPKTA